MDIADTAQNYIEHDLQNRIINAASDIPKGNPGECMDCGEWSSRLVGGVCAPCREMEEIKAKRRIGR